jgi:hypothetical protein
MPEYYLHLLEQSGEILVPDSDGISLSDAGGKEGGDWFGPGYRRSRATQTDLASRGYGCECRRRLRGTPFRDSPP